MTNIIMKIYKSIIYRYFLLFWKLRILLFTKNLQKSFSSSFFFPYKILQHPEKERRKRAKD